MTSPSTKFETKELSDATWPDLEKLFRKPGIGDSWWCWCTFHHTASFSANLPRARAERAIQNRQEQKKLVDEGESHGVIVYDHEKEPVGWCQYGPSGELPRMDHNRNYQRLKLEKNAAKLWRITCFAVDKEYRRQGVASFALKAAVEAIRKKGGGLIEAFPVSKTDQGPGYMYSGRMSTFERAGFRKAAVLSTGRTSTLVMRKSV